jgi:thiamine-phosphate pyrophosphorylase
VLREKDLGKTRRLTLGRELATRLSSCAGRLIIASDAELAAELGASLHLAATDALPAVAPEVVGRSCHDVESLLRALAEGVAYATLSPTFASSSKPGYGPTLGVEGLAAGVAAVPHLPVYALGGVATANIGLCLAAGAAGVAVMGAVMAAEDPFTATRDLVAALERADQRKRSGPRR